ncbi:uncharacterized protein E6C27_scaffold154G001730 [Cucumis melo var. makuwa]|uniref:Uncharacterized protein n=1 Tax=Cucumis melo var. makuwa TaxID=1194695 RepID=A0A5A7V931_CUCMM|nr:uncharacterized protein E6C27_scaffold154G001730 [Cucumis melo var. makuwa]
MPGTLRDELCLALFSLRLFHEEVLPAHYKRKKKAEPDDLQAENLIDALRRFKRMIKRCPYHNIPGSINSHEWRDDAFGSRNDNRRNRGDRGRLEDGMDRNTMVALQGQVTEMNKLIQSMALSIKTYQTRKWRTQDENYSAEKRLTRPIAKPEDKIEDVLVKVDKFFLSTDFVILDYKADLEVPIILGQPFLSTGCTLIDVHQEELTMHFNNEEITFNVINAMKFPANVENYSAIESLGWDYCKEEAYYELFSTEEFLEEDEPDYILEEVNAVSGEKKFKPLDL